MTSVSRSGIFIGRKAHWKEPRVGSALCVADFASTRGRRVAHPDDNQRQLDIEFELRRSAAERRRQTRDTRSARAFCIFAHLGGGFDGCANRRAESGSIFPRKYQAPSKQARLARK